MCYGLFLWPKTEGSMLRLGSDMVVIHHVLRVIPLTEDRGVHALTNVHLTFSQLPHQWLQWLPLQCPFFFFCSNTIQVIIHVQLWLHQIMAAPLFPSGCCFILIQTILTTNYEFNNNFLPDRYFYGSSECRILSRSLPGMMWCGCDMQCIQYVSMPMLHSTWLVYVSTGLVVVQPKWKGDGFHCIRDYPGGSIDLQSLCTKAVANPVVSHILIPTNDSFVWTLLFKASKGIIHDVLSGEEWSIAAWDTDEFNSQKGLNPRSQLRRNALSTTLYTHAWKKNEIRINVSSSYSDHTYSL